LKHGPKKKKDTRGGKERLNVPPKSPREDEDVTVFTKHAFSWAGREDRSGREKTTIPSSGGAFLFNRTDLTEGGKSSFCKEGDAWCEKGKREKKEREPSWFSGKRKEKGKFLTSVRNSKKKRGKKSSQKTVL